MSKSHSKSSRSYNRNSQLTKRRQSALSRLSVYIPELEKTVGPAERAVLAAKSEGDPHRIGYAEVFLARVKEKIAVGKRDMKNLLAKLGGS